MASKKILKLNKNESGQALTEWALGLALFALVMIGAVCVLTAYSSRLFKIESDHLGRAIDYTFDAPEVTDILYYKIENNTLYISGHEKEGYSERVLSSDLELSKTGWYLSEAKYLVKTVVFEESVSPVACTRLFQGMSKLEKIINIDCLFLDYCEGTTYMFDGCSSLGEIDASIWETINTPQA